MWRENSNHFTQFPAVQFFVYLSADLTEPVQGDYKQDLDRAIHKTKYKEVKIISPPIIIIIIIIIIIDVAIPGDRNVIKKEAEKILKYKDLTIKMQRMWNVKTRVIPVIIGATGTISKSFRKYVSDIPGNHGVEELQKTAILGTAHIFRKVLT